MQVHHKGGARALLLSDVRALRTFRIGAAGMKVEVQELWGDADSRLAWIVCNSGTWRLPDELYPWAVDVEERAADLGFGDPWPCWVLFEEGPGGEIEVEVSPARYRLGVR